MSVLRFETGNYFLSRLLWHDVPGQQALSALRSGGRQAKRCNRIGTKMPALPCGNAERVNWTSNSARMRRLFWSMAGYGFL